MQEKYWDRIISSKTPTTIINWAEIIEFRDLLRMFVIRDIITVYKQTVLGPIWYILQPVLTTLVFLFVFRNIANISTDGIPAVVFYLSGIVIWNYFSECFNTTAKTFSENANIFGKVYFPRMIVPFSKVISALIKFCLQFLILICVLIYQITYNSFEIDFGIHLLLIPITIILSAIMGLGFGLLFSSLTIRYRDLIFLLQFGLQLFMYASPIIYPLSAVPDQYRKIFILNPMSHIIEGFKYGLIGPAVSFNSNYLLYSFLFAVTLFILGSLIFSRAERNFIDTI